MPVGKTSMMGGKNSDCAGGYCSKCYGAKCLVIGILVLLNLYFEINWAVFIGVILVILGLGRLFMPKCSHC